MLRGSAGSGLVRWWRRRGSESLCGDDTMKWPLWMTWGMFCAPVPGPVPATAASSESESESETGHGPTGGSGKGPGSPT